jgi:hypothetical protein
MNGLNAKRLNSIIDKLSSTNNSHFDVPCTGWWRFQDTMPNPQHYAFEISNVNNPDAPARQFCSDMLTGVPLVASGSPLTVYALTFGPGATVRLNNVNNDELSFQMSIDIWCELGDRVTVYNAEQSTLFPAQKLRMCYLGKQRPVTTWSPFPSSYLATPQYFSNVISGPGATINGDG